LVWTKKSASPDYVNLAETVEALITGTPDGWALPWWSLVDNRVVDVNAFCTLGPETCASLDINDFLIGLGAGEFAPAVILLGLRDKLSCWARQRLFAAYCENDLSSDWGSWTCFDLHAPDAGQVDQFVAYPAGADQFQFKWGPAIDHVGGSGQLNLYRSLGGAPTEGTRFGRVEGNIATEQAPDIARTTGAFDSVYFSAKLGYEVHVCVRFHGGAEDYVPPELVEPPGLVAPTPKTYTDIADLGAELDKLEQKLHWVLDYAAAAASDKFIPLVVDGSTEEPEPDEDIELGPQHLGVIVYAAPVTYETSLEFGDPPRLFHYGRILMGNGDGWLQPIDLTVQPMIVLKPDPTMNVVRVHARDGVTITLQKLVKPPPAAPPP
jgi:hypothetical protein